MGVTSADWGTGIGPFGVTLRGFAVARDEVRRIGVARGRFAVPDDIDRSNPEVRELFEGS